MALSPKLKLAATAPCGFATFRGTRQTIEAACIRPRQDGYLQLQVGAGLLIEAHLRGDIGAAELYDALCRAFGASFI